MGVLALSSRKPDVMTTKRYWADLTAAEFRALDVTRTIAVLPVGAIEQHGPHLPVSADRDIVEEIVARAAPRLDDLPVLFLPATPIGNRHAARDRRHVGG